MITHDSDFTPRGASTGCACVVSGSGTVSKPYIGPWSINSASGWAVLVDGASLTRSFVLYDLTIAGNGSQGSQGIVLERISNGVTAGVTGAQTSVQHTGTGVTVQSSTAVTLDGGAASPHGPGVLTSGGGVLNHNSIGAIDVENSSYVTVRGWQMSANGPPPRQKAAVA